MYIIENIQFLQLISKWDVFFFATLPVRKGEKKLVSKKFLQNLSIIFVFKTYTQIDLSIATLFLSFTRDECNRRIDKRDPRPEIATVNSLVRVVSLA